jgi:hypothetical protein
MSAVTPLSGKMRKRRRSRLAAESTESAIYAGRTYLGSVNGRLHAFKAKTAAGRALGVFDSAHEAMTAVILAARGAGG